MHIVLSQTDLLQENCLVFLKTFTASCVVHLTSAKLIQQGSITLKQKKKKKI